MAHYEPDKIIQLLQLCSWRERTEMTQNGLIELASKLGSDSQSAERTKAQTPNDRYLVDLLSDARKSLKEGSTISKRETYIQLLLNHLGFNYWDDWKEALRKPEYFFSAEKADFESSGKEVTIVVPKLLEKQLYPTLAFVKKSSPIILLSRHEETLIELAKQTLTLLEKSSVIICALPLSWKDQAVKMRDPAWGEFSGTGRILPIWIDVNEWNSAPPFIPFIKQDQSAGGLPGLLTGLLFTDYYTQAQLNIVDKENSGKRSFKENAPHFNNSTIGFYMQGGTVNHLSTGGDQTINNYFD